MYERITSEEVRFPPDVHSDSGRRRTSLQVSLQSQVWGGHVWKGESLSTSQPLRCQIVRWPLTSATFSAARLWPPDRSWSLRTTRWATRLPEPARPTWGKTAAAPTLCPEPARPASPTCYCVWSQLYTGVGTGSCHQLPYNQLPATRLGSKIELDFWVKKVVTGSWGYQVVHRELRLFKNLSFYSQIGEFYLFVFWKPTEILKFIKPKRFVSVWWRKLFNVVTLLNARIIYGIFLSDFIPIREMSVCKCLYFSLTIR